MFFPTKYGRLIERLEQSFPNVEIVRVDKPEDIAERIKGVDALVTANSVYSRDVGQAICRNGTSLRWLQFTTSGIDTALKGGVPDGIPVTNGGGMHAHCVAAHAIMLMLAVMRRLNDCGAARKDRRWLRGDINAALYDVISRNLALFMAGKPFDRVVHGPNPGA